MKVNNCSFKETLGKFINFLLVQAGDSDLNQNSFDTPLKHISVITARNSQNFLAKSSPNQSEPHLKARS